MVPTKWKHSVPLLQDKCSGLVTTPFQFCNFGKLWTIHSFPNTHSPVSARLCARSKDQENTVRDKQGNGQLLVPCDHVSVKTGQCS